MPIGGGVHPISLAIHYPPDPFQKQTLPSKFGKTYNTQNVEFSLTTAVREWKSQNTTH